MAQIVDSIPVGCDETTDRSQRLRECTHDEVDLVGKSEVIANTTALLTKYTDTMSLVDHDRAVVLVLELNDSWQISQVALHREHAIDHDQLDSILWQLLQYALQVGHVVVLVVQLTGKSQTTTINDRCVVAIVADHVVVLAKQCGDDTLID